MTVNRETKASTKKCSVLHIPNQPFQWSLKSVWKYLSFDVSFNLFLSSSTMPIQLTFNHLFNSEFSDMPTNQYYLKKLVN